MNKSTQVLQMEKHSIQPGCWPTENQELLLEACLFQGEKAICAWEAWHPRINIDWLDEASHRLLPLLYHNLAPLGVKHPILDRAKGVYRYMLTKNHVMFRGVREILLLLEKAGIKVMLLKGMALTFVHYKNFALRPQLDIDILIPGDKAILAFDLIEKAKWHCEYNFPAKTILFFRHSCGFDAGAGKRIDLHWNLLPLCRGSEKIHDLFWNKAVALEHEGLHLLALSPTHQIFHNVIHGVRWNTHAPCRWVADVMTLLQQPGIMIDWKEMDTLAKAGHAALPLFHGLQYLKKRFAAPVPEATLETLQAIPGTAADRWAYHIQTHNKNFFFGNFFKFLSDYLMLPLPGGFLKKWILFPRYLQVCWKKENPFLMPFELAQDGFRKLGQLLK